MNPILFQRGFSSLREATPTIGEPWEAEIYPPHWAGDPTSSPTGTPVLSVFLFGGNLRIKPPLRSRSVSDRRGGDFDECCC
jgi:hypothetical protein